ncbi:hypothetical protein CU098_006206, partial [Rhizopus stolonifer]
SAELIGRAIKNKPSFIQLKHTEATHEVTVMISHSNNKGMFDSDTFLLNINSNQERTPTKSN